MSKALDYLVDKFMECTSDVEYRHIVPQAVLRGCCPNLSDEDFQQNLAAAYRAGLLTLLSIEGNQRYISRGVRLGHPRRKAA